MDARLFAATAVPVLRLACTELSWLLQRGYADNASRALVGDRHRLQKRQRTAISRSACSEDHRGARLARAQPLSKLRGASLAIDGFNCLISVEAALGGGVLLRGRDTALRDLASVHGSYRRVDATYEALRRLIAQIVLHEPAEVVWWLDRPVSNSGRLKAMIESTIESTIEPATTSRKCATRWEVRLDFDPDTRLREHAGVIASSDAAVLDGCEAWVDLPSAVVRTLVSDDAVANPWCVDFSVLATC